MFYKAGIACLRCDVYLCRMLNLIGELNEEELAMAARRYLPTYGNKEKESAEIPFRHNGVRKVAEFLWLGGQWVFISVK